MEGFEVCFFQMLRYPSYLSQFIFFFRQEMIASKMGPFWPGLIATILASMVTLTNTTRSNGGCESEDDHFYLIKHRNKRNSDGQSQCEPGAHI